MGLSGEISLDWQMSRRREKSYVIVYTSDIIYLFTGSFTQHYMNTEVVVTGQCSYVHIYEARTPVLTDNSERGDSASACRLLPAQFHMSPLSCNE